MRILSIIIHGGTLILCYHKSKHYLFFLIPIFFLCSCDIWHLQTFERYNSKRVELQNEISTTQVSCSYFHGCYYLHYSLKGDYCTVNYDSLKLNTNDDNLMIHCYLSYKGVHKYKIRKEMHLSVRLGFNRKDMSIGVVDPLILTILPSDFITFNGQRITDDTLRVELKPGLKFY